jgi:hypothetical protein
MIGVLLGVLRVEPWRVGGVILFLVFFGGWLWSLVRQAARRLRD